MNCVASLVIELSPAVHSVPFLFFNFSFRTIFKRANSLYERYSCSPLPSLYQRDTYILIMFTSTSGARNTREHIIKIYIRANTYIIYGTTSEPLGSEKKRAEIDNAQGAHLPLVDTRPMHGIPIFPTTSSKNTWFFIQTRTRLLQHLAPHLFFSSTMCYTYILSSLICYRYKSRGLCSLYTYRAIKYRRAFIRIINCMPISPCV